MRGPASAGRSVVFFAGQDWWYHNRAHSDMQLALQVARSRRVLLINSIGTRMPLPGRSTQVRARLTRKFKSILRGVRQPVADLPEFFVYSPVSLPLYQSRLARRLNTFALRVQIRIVCRWLRITEPDLIVTPPTAWETVRGLPRRSLTFNRSDKHSAWAEVDQSFVERCEHELLRRSDLILYVSHALMTEDAALTGERAYFLDHGVDIARFDPDGPVAEPVAALPDPRVGYFGALRDVTVDVGLIEAVADGLPDATVVLVGPSTVDMTELTRRPNLQWVGPQSHEDIPSFGRGFDVAIMPWHDNDWIRNCNPVKLKEYLALGLPIVTTPFPEVERYAAHVRQAAGPDAFIDAVRRALAEPGDAGARRQAVAEDSWQARGRQLLEQIDRLA